MTVPPKTVSSFSSRQRLVTLTVSLETQDTKCVAVCCSVLQCVAVCCSVLQCVAVCCVFYRFKTEGGEGGEGGGKGDYQGRECRRGRPEEPVRPTDCTASLVCPLRYVHVSKEAYVCCSVMKCVAESSSSLSVSRSPSKACCRVLQRVAVCSSVL